MRRGPVALAWSGGKDSMMTLLTLRRSGAHVVELLTTTEGYDRVSMHGVRAGLLARQADALGLPVRRVPIARNCSNADYEAAMAAALTPLRAAGVRQVAYGDLALQDVRAYREGQMEALGMSAVFPVWGRDTAAFVDEFLSRGFRAVVVCVDTAVLPANAAGCELDADFLASLPDGVDPCGENGEFHTFVYDGPAFRSPVGWTRGEQVVRDGFGYCDLAPA